MVPGPPIRVVLADDHRIVIAGLRALLAPLDDVHVVGAASDGDELLRVLAAVAADVVLTDIIMPRVDGITALQLIRERHSSLKVIMVSMDDSASSIRAAVAAGANGFVRKNASAAELATAIRSTVASGGYFSGEVMERLAQKIPPTVSQLLTDRQVKILQLCAQGRGTKEIAFELGISTKSVDAHRRRIMEQLHVSDIPSLTRFALRHGLVDP